MSRVNRSNPGKGVAPSATPRCSSYWKGSLQVALDNGRHSYFYFYVYTYTHKHIHTHTQICIHTCTHLHTQSDSPFLSLSLSLSLFHTRTRMRARALTQIYVCVCVCAYQSIDVWDLSGSEKKKRKKKKKKNGLPRAIASKASGVHIFISVSITRSAIFFCRDRHHLSCHVHLYLVHDVSTVILALRENYDFQVTKYWLWMIILPNFGDMI